jgi:hypothetical protein
VARSATWRILAGLAAALASGPWLGLPPASRPVAARAAAPSVRQESRTAREDLTACTMSPSDIADLSGTTGTTGTALVLDRISAIKV